MSAARLGYIVTITKQGWYMAQILNRSFLSQGNTAYGKYATPPWPNYIEADPSLLATSFSGEDGMADESSNNTYDICYHLIKLFCRRTHRLDRLLNPKTHTPNCLDYSLRYLFSNAVNIQHVFVIQIIMPSVSCHHCSWHLLQVLQALGYSHLSEHDLNSLHVNFACQLEQSGSWHRAIFVLLHISDELRQDSAVFYGLCHRP